MNPFETDVLDQKTSRPTPVQGARGLFILHIVELGWYVVNSLFYMIIDPLAVGSEIYLTFSRVGSVLWLLFNAATLALMIPFVKGRRGTNAAVVAKVVVVLFAISLVTDLLTYLPSIGGPDLLAFDSDTLIGRLWRVANFGMFMAIEVCLWLAFTRSTSRVPRPFAGIFYVLLGTSALLALPRMVMPRTEYFDLLGGFTLAFSIVRFAVGLGRSILVILVLRLLVRGEGGAPDGSAMPALPEADPAELRSRDLVVGALWLGGGLLVTIVSYASAAEGGGRYLVTTGAIAYGLVRVIRGLTR